MNTNEIRTVCEKFELWRRTREDGTTTHTMSLRKMATRYRVTVSEEIGAKEWREDFATESDARERIEKRLSQGAWRKVTQ